MIKRMTTDIDIDVDVKYVFRDEDEKPTIISIKIGDFELLKNLPKDVMEEIEEEIIDLKNEENE